MNRSIFLTIALLVSFKCVHAQEIVFDENAEVRNVGAFTGIEISGAMSVYLAQGSTNAIAISAGDVKYNSKIKTEVKNGILKISVDGGLWNGMGWTNKKLKAYVTINSITSIDVSGASYLAISDVLKTDALSIDISGASEIKGALDINKLNIDCSGASVARLSGKTNTLLIDASGAARINAFDLNAENCKADASGASAIRIAVTKEFSASASGGAHIYYKGNPEKSNINSGAGASIRQRQNGDD